MRSPPLTPDDLLLEVGPGLAFRLEGVPAAFGRRVGEFLTHFVCREPRLSQPPLRITAAPPPDGTEPAGEPILVEPPVVVRQTGDLTFFDVPGVRGWCDPLRARAGIVFRSPSDSALEQFARMAFAAMLFELAQGRGWLGLHAAAVSVDGRGILLPAASGAGKSTIFHHAHRSGLGVLSDDLVWLHETAATFRIRALPRNLPDAPVPGPTDDDVALRAIVCPTIAARRDSRLIPLAVPEVLEVLLAQSGFLTGGPLVGERFKAWVRVARSAPAYRLAAGGDREQVPPILAGLFRRPDHPQ
ncbi:MAG: hypothetical protein GY856_33985 [bacterium]|nr:hypothetical protein [bacterium]